MADLVPPVPDEGEEIDMEEILERQEGLKDLIEEERRKEEEAGKAPTREIPQNMKSKFSKKRKDEI